MQCAMHLNHSVWVKHSVLIDRNTLVTETLVNSLKTRIFIYENMKGVIERVEFWKIPGFPVSVFV